MLRNILAYGGKGCLSLVLAAMVCSAATVPAAYAAGKPDDAKQVDQIAGQIADSVKERKPVVPGKAKVKIEVSQEQQEPKETPQDQAGVNIKVKALHITGQTLYREDQLQAAVQDVIGQELTVSELQAVARRIARYFNDRGYLVANAYVPPQDIEDGQVEITVRPGRYDSIDLRNHSKLSNKAANRLLSQIKPGDYVKKDMLERTLLLISDIGGITIHATLAPGSTPGTSKLIVEIKNAGELTSQFSWDSYGNRYTGEDRGNINLNLNNLSGQGDMATIGGNNSSGGMNNFNFSYLLPVGNRGVAVGASYSQLHYSLGGVFDALNANGSAKTTGFYATYPIIRARLHNLFTLVEYNHRKIEDRIDYYKSFTNKHTNGWTISLIGDSQDKYHGGGINSFDFSINAGRLTFDGGRDAYGDSVPAEDNAGLRTAGHYTKFNLDCNRLQYLNHRLNLYLSLSGQLASKNLDATEQIYLGGANGVRAYPQGEAAGDEGYILTGELRWDMPTPKFQLAAFVDNGRVTVNKNPLSTMGANHQTLTGVGLGLILNSRKDYNVRLDYAWRTTSHEAVSDTDQGRCWLKVVEYF